MMTRQYVVTDPERLRMLCIKNEWFTHGTNKQYSKMFELNRKDPDKEAKRERVLHDVALAIWLCSDAEYDDILDKLDEAQYDYFVELAEAHIAEGERAADEVYCGYFD